MKAREETSKVRKMPKGGRKGGTSFPRVSLTDALGYARKLVIKTHSGAQPQDVVYAGVVGAKSGTGNVRIGALKQYGLMKGDTKSGYVAQDLAKKIGSAPPEEISPLLQRAALHPAVFKKIYEAFQGDSVSKAKLRQRAADLDVHPEETATCVDLYVSAMVASGLATVDGETVAHTAFGHPSPAREEEGQLGQPDIGEDEGSGGNDADEAAGRNGNGEGDALDLQNGSGTSSGGRPLRAVFKVNVNLDSSLDTEKLEKQLQLLRRYGAL